MFTDPLDVKGEIALWRSVVYYALADASRTKNFSYFQTRDAKEVLTLAGIEPEWMRRKLDARFSSRPERKSMPVEMVDGIVGIPAPTKPRPPSQFLREARLKRQAAARAAESRRAEAIASLPPFPPNAAPVGSSPIETLLPFLRHYFWLKPDMKDFRTFRHLVQLAIPGFSFHRSNQPMLVDELVKRKEHELADWVRSLPVKK